MISEEEFDRIYPKQLTKKQHPVLDRLLQGKTEPSIAKEINRKDCTVRSHISTIAQKFKIFNQNGQHTQKRELIQLFCRYKPELVSEQVKSEYWNSPWEQSPESNSDIEKPEFQKCYQIISQPGALLRLTGNRQSGKTTLTHQVLERFKKDEQRTVYLSWRNVDSSDLDNLDPFLQWFCDQVGRKIDLPNKVADYWDDTTGSKVKCGSYFEEYLLPNQDSPLVLCLDDFHRMYQGKIVLDICDMLRSWHDNRITQKVWEKLRLVLIYPSEVTPPSNVQNSTLFNTGYVINLSDVN